MTRQELRVFLQDHFCACGDPAAVAGALLNLLEIWGDRTRSLSQELPKLVQDEGCRWLLLYLIDHHLGLVDHGTAVTSSWLEGRGPGVLEALRLERDDGFATLFARHCIHGFDVEGPAAHEHDCAAFDE